MVLAMQAFVHKRESVLDSSRIEWVFQQQHCIPLPTPTYYPPPLPVQDLPRTFPGHPWIQSEEGQLQLRRVLVALAMHLPQVGYCQGLNHVAGLMLLFMEKVKGGARGKGGGSWEGGKREVRGRGEGRAKVKGRGGGEGGRRRKGGEGELKAGAVVKGGEGGCRRLGGGEGLVNELWRSRGGKGGVKGRGVKGGWRERGSQRWWTGSQRRGERWWWWGGAAKRERHSLILVASTQGCAASSQT